MPEYFSRIELPNSTLLRFFSRSRRVGSAARLVPQSDLGHFEAALQCYTKAAETITAFENVQRNSKIKLGSVEISPGFWPFEPAKEFYWIFRKLICTRTSNFVNESALLGSIRFRLSKPRRIKSIDLARSTTRGKNGPPGSRISIRI